MQLPTEVKKKGNMREIKFRAWDKLHDRMIDWQEVTYGQRFDTTYFHPNYADQLILMQYTGLKDKNGKEIYEGDIVIPHAYRKTINSKPGNDWFRFKQEVVFTSGTFRLKNNGAFITKDHIVIGNIYQNPELLEDNA